MTASNDNPSAEDIEWQDELQRLSGPKLNDKLCDAVESKSLWRVKAALEAGADVHASGDQPLRRAAVSGLFDIARTLVEAGANLHVNDEEPLCWAARDGNAALVEYFLSKGIKDNSYGARRARNWAADYKQPETLLLLDNAAEIRANKTKTGLSMAEEIAGLLERGDPLPLAEVRKGDTRSRIYLFILADAQKLDVLFEPAGWAGDTAGMVKLWNDIPKKFQEQIDLPAKVAGVKAHALKSKKPPKLKF